MRELKLMLMLEGKSTKRLKNSINSKDTLSFNDLLSGIGLFLLLNSWIRYFRTVDVL